MDIFQLFLLTTINMLCTQKLFVFVVFGFCGSHRILAAFGLDSIVISSWSNRRKTFQIQSHTLRIILKQKQGEKEERKRFSSYIHTNIDFMQISLPELCASEQCQLNATLYVPTKAHKWSQTVRKNTQNLCELHRFQANTYSLTIYSTVSSAILDFSGFIHDFL